MLAAYGMPRGFRLHPSGARSRIIRRSRIYVFEAVDAIPEFEIHFVHPGPFAVIAVHPASGYLARNLRPSLDDLDTLVAAAGGYQKEDDADGTEKPADQPGSRIAGALIAHAHILRLYLNRAHFRIDWSMVHV
jgi:hypothetical protein